MRRTSPASSARPERRRPDNSEVERLYACIDKAKRLLGWSPALAGREGFARGLAETAEWFSEPANLARYRIGHYAT